MKIINTYCPEAANYGDLDHMRNILYVLTQDGQGLYAVYTVLVVAGPTAAIYHELAKEYAMNHGIKMKEAAARCYFDIPEGQYRN